MNDARPASVPPAVSADQADTLGIEFVGRQIDLVRGLQGNHHCRACIGKQQGCKNPLQHDIRAR